MRNAVIDQMKGIGILAVIVGHVSDYATTFIFSFHMPLFFIIAGYFHKPGIRIKKDAQRLLVPFYFSALVWLSYIVVFDIASGSLCLKERLLTILWASGSPRHSSALYGNLPMVGAIWFLFALFWCKNVFAFIHTKINNQYLLGLASVSLSAVAIVVDTLWINLPLAFLPGLGAIIFYWAGYLISKKGGFDKIPVILTITGVIFWILSFSFGRMSMVRCFYTHPVINILGGVGATIFIYMIRNKLKIGEGILSFIGEISMAILCVHNLETMSPVRAFLGIP